MTDKALQVIEQKTVIFYEDEITAVYGEVYRRFGISSYKLLPARRFAEAMKFLTDWHADLTGETPF
jgi:hypothetical protein